MTHIAPIVIMPKATRNSTQKAKNGTQTKKEKEPDARRERSLRACTRCRQRKQRCDNALPHCSNCIKGGVPCEAFPINVVSRENLLQYVIQTLPCSIRYGRGLDTADITLLCTESMISYKRAHDAMLQCRKSSIWPALPFLILSPSSARFYLNR